MMIAVRDPEAVATAVDKSSIPFAEIFKKVLEDRRPLLSPCSRHANCVMAPLNDKQAIFKNCAIAGHVQ